MKLLRVLLVDDEPAARRGMRMHLDGHAGFEIVGECDDGDSMVATVGRLRPDIVFLDIQMPGMNGFEALGRLEPPVPQVIFVTAYDRYAVQAFEAHAVDYLLKPYSAERFLQACERARERCAKPTEEYGRTLETLLEQMARQEPAHQRLVLRSAGKVVLVDLSDVGWMTGAGDYVRLHTGTKTHLVRETLRELEGRLEEDFVRVHRSTIVRLSAIRQIVRRPNGRWEIELPDGSRRAVSRNGRQLLEQALDTTL